MKSPPDIQHSISHLGKVTVSKKSVVASSQWRKGLMLLIYEKNSQKPKPMNHYLKLFQSPVFFFNLPSLPHLVAQITEELTRALFLLPAYLAYLVLFKTLWLLSGVKGIYEVVLKEPFFMSTVWLIQVTVNLVLAASTKKLSVWLMVVVM